VQVAISEAEIASGLNPAQGEFSAEIPAATGLASSMPRQLASGSAMDRSTAVRAAFVAGALGVFVGIIPLLGIVLTGALAVYLYRSKSRVVLAPALGARLGGAAGVVAFAINALLITIRIVVFHAQQEYVDFLSRVAHTVGANAADPDFQAGIHSLLTPSGLAITFLFGMIIAAVLASLGGALASLFLRPRKPGA
jgi:hypothetical protein